MVSAIISRVVVLTAGTLYPAYRSYKAVRTKDVREYVKWMMYWIVYALFCFFETIADIFVSFWFPFYYEFKILFVFWLLSPWTKGASILYRKWVHPTLVKHEEEIDNMLEQAKSESYNKVIRFGSQSLLRAREVIATAASLGQAELVNQLQRSYSANDVNRDPSTFKRRFIPEGKSDADKGKEVIWEEEYDESRFIDSEGGMEVYAHNEDAETMRRSTRNTRRRTTPVDKPSSEPVYNTLPKRTGRTHKASS
ncbi:hypothetical protein AB6A40_007841 [Gnathostoma spinigerum]|uniref:Receptor expression-enhancing protein n=1 Tax=Gnathostoma spinigerum TaxID=75299 RepID=A0ABD6EPM8_9BILA